MKEEAFLASISHLGDEDRKAAMAARSREAASRAQRAEHLVRIGKLKQLAAQGKLSGAVEWVKDFFEGAEGQKLVVYAYHQEIQRKLLDAFPRGTVRIFGEDSARDREEAVHLFQVDPTTRLMVASLRAGREGITLTAASNVAFLEQGWTPGGAPAGRGPTAPHRPAGRGDVLLPPGAGHRLMRTSGT